tara:strand:- start:674 stop:874 length:201 start_codon:yes stop_codon:yes gene_type:complete
MEEIVDLIATDASPSDISDKVKDLLYAKSAERIDALKPTVSNVVFDAQEEQPEASTEEPTEQEQEE